MQYLIIGNSTAAIGGIEGIRAVDPEGAITVAGAEPYESYARPLISYLLEGKTDLERMRYRPQSFYDEANATVLRGVRATALNAQEKTVTLDDGKTLSYDRLLLATGSKPLMPPVQGLDAVQNVHTFYTLDDALGLQAALTPSSRVLIIGAGLIGLKCAEAVKGLAATVTVVERAPQILPSVLDAEAAARVQAYLEAQGIAVRVNASVSKVDSANAYLQDGTALAFDALVVAAGVQPEVDLARQAGAAIDRGILMDAHGRTSLADVYAAGDCAQGPELLSGQQKTIAILPNAYQQGYAAGATMAGEDTTFDKAVAMNALSFMGLHALTAGQYTGDVRTICTDTQYKKLFIEDDRLVGFILLGEVDRAGIYTALIRERVPLSSIDFALIAEKPQLMAFSRQERSRKMGGVPV